MGRFADIASKLGDLAGQGSAGRLDQRRVMEFSPVKDGENVALWKDLVNVRYERDGIREDIKLRGGTKLAEEIGSTDIISMHAFQSSVEGATTDYLIYYTNLSLTLYDITNDTYTSLGSPASLGMDTTNRLQFFVNGQFLYVFQYKTGSAHYIDLKNKSIYKWQTADTRRLIEYTTITDGSFTEKNIWGMKEAGSIYAYVDNFSWTLYGPGVVPAQGFLEQGVYKYEYSSGGKYLIINGTDYKKNTLIILTSKTGVEVGGSGTEYSLEAAEIPVINGSINFKPQITKINTITTGESSNLIIDNPWQIIPDTEIGINNSSDVQYIPAGVDIAAVLDQGGPYKADEDSITVNANWSEPSLHRIYTICYELNDGSVTHHSVPLEVNIDVGSIMQVNELVIRGVKLKHYTNAFEVPDQAVRGYLFCSRWQVKSQDCYGTRPDYPNGTLYYAGSFSVSDQFIYDYTPDSKLQQTLSSFLPTVKGKPTTLPKRSIYPKSIAPVENSIIIAGYKLSRPIPEVSKAGTGASNTYFITTGSDVTDLFIDVVFEYSDGLKSRACSDHISDISLQVQDGTNTFKVKTQSTLVEKITLYLEDRSTGTYYLVKEFTDNDPEWFGYPIEVSDNTTDYDSVTLSAGVEENETLQLDNYVAWASPPQMIDISSQKELTGVDEIVRVHASQIDDKRGDQLRYLMYVLTNNKPAISYLNANIRDEGFVFDIATETLTQQTPLISPQGSVEFMNGVLFQSKAGMYLWRGKSLQKILDTSRYDVLSSPLKDSSWHARESELWFVGANNIVLIFNTPTQGDIDTPSVYLMDYSGGTDYSFNAITDLNGVLYGGFSSDLYELDKTDYFTDDFKNQGGADQRIYGSLTSDYLSGPYQQMYLDVIELLGKGISCKVEVDLQYPRFDEFDDRVWVSYFIPELTKDTVDVTMKGIVRELYTRGVQPRIRLTLFTPADLEFLNDSRLSAARLYFNLIEHEGVVRF